MSLILKKIFQAKQNATQFWIASIGFLLGLFLCLVSLQLYWQISQLLAPNEKNAQYLVLSKKITLNNVLMLSRAEFTPAEIKEIEKQKFVQKVGAFTSNQFEVLAYSKGDLPFMTELFFESVPTEFLDEVPNNWDWQEKDMLIPVILSQDFLNLYNFGYALGKGLPQLNKATVGLLTVNIRIKGAKGEQVFSGKVVGFSERIPSVIVPQSFMEWANQNIGDNKTVNPSRVVLKITNPTHPDVVQFMEKKGYQINQDRANAGKAGSIIQIVISIITVIGFIFIGLALIIFMMNFRLMLAEAKEEVILLFDLGYTQAVLANYLIYRFVIFILSISIFAFILLFFSNYYTEIFLQQNGLDIPKGIATSTFMAGLGFIGSIILINIWAIYRLLKRNF